MEQQQKKFDLRDIRPYAGDSRRILTEEEKAE